MSGILKTKRWESLKKRRRDSRLILLYKGLKRAVSIQRDDHIPAVRHCRNHLLLTFETLTARTAIYKGSCFPQTVRDGTVIQDSVISSAEGAEDGVARITSLVRARN